MDERVLAAHRAGDLAALAGLYAAAADLVDDPDAAGFFLTQAYIFALDSGDPAAAALHRRLVSLGRDA
ncbi:MAG: hypothetical protein QNJ44_03690 [Rhodobacter sp.]|nr:hypothetical protein [Rhodobacter sp.]